MMSVEDDGDGIPPDYQKQVFRAGWTSKGAKGHGIGLAIADLMAKDLGGRLDLVSPGPSGGAETTIFSIRLPLNVD